MKNVKVCILRTAGTNCDQETAFAFKTVGGETEFVHIKELVEARNNLADFHILALPGGFSYGDDIASGKILANEMANKLSAELIKFIADGKLIIGICNGFQILVKSGLLPKSAGLKQETSLIINDSGKFEDRWVYLRKAHDKCVWTKNLKPIIYLPVAHGEGKFVAQDKNVLERLKNNGQVVFEYCDEKGKLARYPYNPNGSEENIAGICDETGRVFGLMPHPERHIQFTQAPRWTAAAKAGAGDGMQIFRNGVEYAKANL
ncbi:MAG: phosphoribosylformylglycinamidine synthase I [Candidatus Omnitrophota bacterium]|jgi:phosphoribosylformylglycinamidine synthase